LCKRSELPVGAPHLSRPAMRRFHMASFFLLRIACCRVTVAAQQAAQDAARQHPACQSSRRSQRHIDACHGDGCFCCSYVMQGASEFGGVVTLERSHSSHFRCASCYKEKEWAHTLRGSGRRRMHNSAPLAQRWCGGAATTRPSAPATMLSERTCLKPAHTSAKHIKAA
jgi:hypothetical protein